VLVAAVEGEPQPDPAEVLEVRWASWAQVVDLVTAAPWAVSPWAALQVTQLAGLAEPPWSLLAETC
jgi:isopentenyl-diphosphate delta-isomerase